MTRPPNTDWRVIERAWLLAPKRLPQGWSALKPSFRGNDLVLAYHCLFTGEQKSRLIPRSMCSTPKFETLCASTWRRMAEDIPGFTEIRQPLTKTTELPTLDPEPFEFDTDPDPVTEVELAEGYVRNATQEDPFLRQIHAKHMRAVKKTMRVERWLTLVVSTMFAFVGGVAVYAMQQAVPTLFGLSCMTVCCPEIKRAENMRIQLEEIEPKPSAAEVKP